MPTRRDSNRCAVHRCRRTDIAVIYLGVPVCRRCWDRHAEAGPAHLRTVLSLPPALAAVVAGTGQPAVAEEAVR